MDGQTPYVVRVGLERRDLLVCIVVEDAQLEVVRAGHEPVLARDKTHAAYGHLGDLEGLDERAAVAVVDVHGAVVEAGEQPRLGRVKIDILDPF